MSKNSITAVGALGLGETLKQVAFQKTEPEAAALVSERKVRR
jgi:hypothetical protein